VEYITCELARVGVIIQRAVQRWQQAGQNPKEPFRGLFISKEEAAHLARQPLAGSWGSAAALSAKDEEAYLQAYQQAAGRSQAILDQAANAQVGLRLAHLVDVFGLSAFEYNAFLLCLAPALDVRYERLFGFLQDDVTRKLASLNLIFDLLLDTGIQRMSFAENFDEQAILLRYGLLQVMPGDPGETVSLLRRVFSVPQEVVAWLFGGYRPAPALADGMELILPGDTDGRFETLEDETSLPDAARLVEKKPLLAFYGADHQRAQAAALRLARVQAQPLLRVDLEALKTGGQLSRANLRLALRDAILLSAVPYFTGWEQLADAEGMIPAVYLGELDEIDETVIVLSAAPWRTSGEPGPLRKPLLWQAFDLPSSEQRRKLWALNLNGSTPLDETMLEILAGQFTLSTGQIQQASRTALNTAFQKGRPLQLEDLLLAARQHSTHHLDSLAVKLEPRYRWEDIVLPPDGAAVLQEIAATIRSRPLVLETWGVGRKLAPSAGVSALFTGPPGTGKTLAAQVIAAELGMDLYKIDLSTVVSKYIGETEKNLERIFNQARNSSTILFFDEADAIFGKRSEVKDAHDRYANIEVGYLLQRMETFDGVVILASNLYANLDEAFIRRLQFVVDFPFPDEEQRARIWRVLFPPGVPRDPQLDFSSLANRFRLSGANIRNAIISAAFLAANEGSSVTTRHLLHGIRRELQKMGRLIDEKDLSSV
jgi:hypothetical protein